MKLNPSSDERITEASRTDAASLQELANKLNGMLKNMPTAEGRLEFVLNLKDHNVGLTTSFGIQSALMLHLVTKATPKTRQAVPVIWIDTGYLPQETHDFGEHLQKLLNLDLHVYESKLSPARMEALHGKLWEDPSDDAHRMYNYIRKVEPMQRALRDLDLQIVLSGLRADQTSHRKNLDMVHVHNGRLKICPILDWSDEDVSNYFEKHALPFHPLHHQGYRSVGDWHSSKPFDPLIHTSERETRFHGRTQECGLHVEDSIVIPRIESFTSVIIPNIVWDNGGFVLYTKPKCRFCVAAKALVKHLALLLVDGESLPTQDFEVGKDINLAELERGLQRSIKTVPQILYKGEYIGGHDDLVAWTKRKFPGATIPPEAVVATNLLYVRWASEKR